MTKPKQNEITEGDEIAIRLTVSTGHCAIGMQSIYGRVTGETPKAIEVTSFEGQKKVWFPRRALVKGQYRGGFKLFSIAKWFNPDQRHWSSATTSTLVA